jgi:predicted metal-dependent enzyme (double-stranded beta helix superfamily)
MSNSLEDFADQIRDALSADSGVAGKQQVCDIVARYVLDEDFINTHLTTRADSEPAREILYEDSQLGFCICGHVFNKGQNAPPHDHGTTWAIYGQATGQTVMTDWDIVNPDSHGSESDPKQVVQKGAAYPLNPGDAHLYDVGAVHSLVREEPVKTIRIEGANVDNLKRSKIVKAPQ